MALNEFQQAVLDDGPKKKPLTKPDTLTPKRDAELKAVMDEGPPKPGETNVERIKHYDDHLRQIVLLNALIGNQKTPSPSPRP